MVGVTHSIMSVNLDSQEKSFPHGRTDKLQIILMGCLHAFNFTVQFHVKQGHDIDLRCEFWFLSNVTSDVILNEAGFVLIHLDTFKILLNYPSTGFNQDRYTLQKSI